MLATRAAAGKALQPTILGVAGLLLAGRAVVPMIAPPSLASATASPGTESSATCNDQWPMFQHDQSRTAAPACSGLDQGDVTTLHPAWHLPTAGDVTAEPVVADGLVFVGDSTGVFSAVDQPTGKLKWSFNVTSNSVYDDQHAVSFGEIPGTAAVARIGKGDPTVFMVGGGTVYALDALTGAPRWAQDTDPAHPTSAVETESSPVVDTSTARPEVILGNDTNQSTGIAMTGMLAFDALGGTLRWKYEPQTNQVITPGEFCSGKATYGCASRNTTFDALSYGDNNSGTEPDNACGDVWSSPALDQAKGRLMFATGDCPQTTGDPKQFTTIQSVFALDATTGNDVWRFAEPQNAYDQVAGQDGDDDFGASPIITGVDDSAGHRIVVEAGKSGYVYGLDEASGRQLWQTQAAQPGQLSPQLVGAVGGFIGSPALGPSNGQPALFLTSAVFTPLAGDGANTGSPSQPCPALGGQAVPACPDTTLAGHPARLASVHAVSVADGKILWQAPISTPTYAPATYSHGVVFAPSTTTAAVAAYDADNGVPLWEFPLAAPGASGAAIAGSSVYVGSGVSEGGQSPGPSGVWSFTSGTGGGV